MENDIVSDGADVHLTAEEKKALQEKAALEKGRNLIKNSVYITLFVLSLCVVVRLVPFEMVLLAVILLVFNMDRKVLTQVDYCLLLTFIAFFISYISTSACAR